MNPLQASEQSDEADKADKVCCENKPPRPSMRSITHPAADANEDEPSDHDR